MKTCIICEKEIQSHRKFCSNSCQAESTKRNLIEKWKKKEIPGHCGVALLIRRFVRDYLLKKYGYKCPECGWDKRHPLTNESCLEVDHIDGDASNSWEENLRVLCPNCHSLTPTHRRFNKVKSKRFRVYTKK